MPLNKALLGEIITFMEHHTDVLPELQETVDICRKKLIGEKPKQVFYFLTVNPKPDVKLEFFQKQICNFIKRKPISDWAYSIEQRGETIETMGKGFHAHFLLTWESKSAGKIRQYAGESFKRCIGSNTNNIVNINKIDDTMYQDKMDYLNGLKWDTEKDEKIKIDILFRAKNNISCIYKKDGLQEVPDATPSTQT